MANSSLLETNSHLMYFIAFNSPFGTTNTIYVHISGTPKLPHNSESHRTKAEDFGFSFWKEKIGRKQMKCTSTTQTQQEVHWVESAPCWQMICSKSSLIGMSWLINNVTCPSIVFQTNCYWGNQTVGSRKSQKRTAAGLALSSLHKTKVSEKFQLFPE